MWLRWLRENAPFHLLVVGAFAFLTIPRMAQPGMFVDGVTYASIARNLAEGTGQLWSPFYTSTLYPQFYEHPPLGFALQAAAFAVFGDHLAVERTYSVAFGVVTGLLMILIWRRTIGVKAYEWLPVVFWVLPSTVTWSIVNNMLETTQTAFTTLAVLAFVCALQSSRWWAWGLLSGASILAAALTKGPTGFFPLAAPLVAAFVFRSRRPEALRAGVAMLAALGAGCAALALSPGPRALVSTYWSQQVLASISGARGGDRWVSLARHLGGDVVMRMGIVLGLAGVLWRFGPGRHDREPASPPAWGWFFLALALAGSLPVASSARIVGHYLVPSIPFYALGAASLSLALVGPAFDRWRGSRLVTSIVSAFGASLLVASVAVPTLGGALEPRDVDWIADFRRLAPSVPRGTTVGTCEAVLEEWRLHAYMMRFFEVSLDARSGSAYPSYLRLADRPCNAPPACRSGAATGRLALLACQ